MDTRLAPKTRFGIIAIAGAMLLGACDSAEYLYPNRKRSQGGSGPTYSYGDPRAGQPSVFGEGGVLGGLFGRPGGEGGGGGGIGVNNYLWRASLDSISFMPLASADPFGGVIVTEWHSLPETPQERFKINLFILGRELRADGIRAAVFRQRMDKGNWVDVAVEEGTATRLEDAILSRARELRLAQQR